MRLKGRRRRGAAGAERGFALVIVLWVLAGLSVVAVTVAASASNSAQSVKLLRDRVAAERAFLSTAAQLAVMASTSLAQRSYLDSDRGRLFVDGRITQVNQHEWVQLQDVRGLLNLNRPNAERLRGLLRHCGASDGQAPALADALADYVDTDSLKRLNGAEAFDYRGTDLTEPRNAALLSREEMWRVMGFAALKERWATRGCDALVTVHGDGSVNRNTSPLPLLLADGVSETAATALIDARKDGLPSLEIQSGGNDPSNPFTFVAGGYPGNVLRIRHQIDSIEWTLEYELELTPQRNGGPWRLHELRNPPNLALPVSAGASLPAVDFRTPERDRRRLNAAPNLPFAN